MDFHNTSQKSTTENEIINHLSTLCKVECTKLDLQSSNYVAPFHIRLPFDKNDDVMDSKIWPRGMLINKTESAKFGDRQCPGFFTFKHDAQERDFKIMQYNPSTI